MKLAASTFAFLFLFLGFSSGKPQTLISGNQEIPHKITQSVFGTPFDAPYILDQSGIPMAGFTFVRTPNPNLQWEESRQVNFGFLTGPQFHPNGSLIEDTERTNLSGSFAQLDYTPEISGLTGAFRHESARVIKYELNLQAPDCIRQDLARFGQFTRAWEHKPPSEGFREVFPIPQVALDVNPNLKQNPDY